MKKLLLSFMLVAIASCYSIAQCASTPTSYDLTVSGNVTLPPSGPSYVFGIICSGGHLIDSAMCCTRQIYIQGGGIYEAGPNAYGIVFIKSGGTFDAHGNTSFFSVNYETGAIILNYTGPLNLCTAVTFPPGTCIATEILDGVAILGVNTYPNPCNDVLHFENNFSKDAMALIYDIAGKKCKEITFSTNEINVADLPLGIYSFEIVLDNKKVSFGKFAIVR